MDDNAQARKRLKNAPYPPRGPTDRRTQQEKLRRPASGKIRLAKDSSEIIRLPRRTTESLERPSADEDPRSRHFTVANVGAGGTLYLKPSRMPPPNFTQPPATPPNTSDGDPRRSDIPGVRQSNVSGSWSPRLQAQKIGAHDPAVSMPPLSIANVRQKPRPRSHSFSTISERKKERARAPTLDDSDVQLLLNGCESHQRPKSSMDLSSGFLDLQIPNYRIGTPRFSDRGTAYLHNSTYTATTGTDEVRSSAFSRAEYDQLFPAPPGRPHIAEKSSRTPSPYLSPSAAMYSLPLSRASSRTPSAAPSVTVVADSISPAVYERIEAVPNDPSIVRYSKNNGRIVAATTARLIAQITSPVFLDYELLSDFFLTFRSFLPPRGLMEYLLARMQWALGTNTNAGRVVRVRSFVALRHWILNYFADDFALDVILRQRLCDLVNEMTTNLKERQDQGGSDMNIIGELKKCWRRTTAMFWPVEDALDTSPDTDIAPGGEERSQDIMPADVTPPSSPPKSRKSRTDFRRESRSLNLPIEHDVDEEGGAGDVARTTRKDSTVTMRTASIPTSPMSECSLQVLSCSVPFLRHIRPSRWVGERNGTADPSSPRKNPPLSGKNGRPSHQHKRSGSFSDALRDGRTPLPSMRADSIDIRSLPAIAMTGGLVRGLLLQPSPAKVNLLIPLSPPSQDLKTVQFGGIDENYFSDRQGQNAGVKRLMGDMRRALSSRKGRPESPNRSNRSTHSSDSRSSANLVSEIKTSPTSAWQKLRGPPRVDVLGAQIGESYKDAFHDVDLPSPTDRRGNEGLDPSIEGDEEYLKQPIDGLGLQPPPNLERLNSHVTTSSRSIVIMDDTGLVDKHLVSGGLPAIESMSSGMTPHPLFGRSEEALRPAPGPEEGDVAGNRNTASAQYDSWAAGHSSDIPLHDLLTPYRTDEYGNPLELLAPPSRGQARKSSSVNPDGLDMPQLRHQLRRKPGGDLKAADHVHDLELSTRPLTSGSFSTATQSYHNSLAQQLSGTHFSGQQFDSWRLPAQVIPDVKPDSVSLLATHSSQPNMRPSFEAQMSSLSRLSGGTYLGGIEDALMKLEGKRSSSANDVHAGPRAATAALEKQQNMPIPPRAVEPYPLTTTSTPLSDAVPLYSPQTETQGASIYHLSQSDAMGDWRLQSMHSSDQYGRSEAQDSAAPVLPPPPKSHKFRIPAQLSSPKSVTFLEEVARNSMYLRSPTRSDAATKPETPKGSFLLDDNESLSDISTEIGNHSGDDSLGMHSFFFDDTAEGEDALPRSTFRPPPTPPSTSGDLGEQSPRRNNIRPPLKEAQSAPGLLSSPIEKERTQLQQPPQKSPPSLPLPPQPDLRRVKTSPGSNPAHLPFVLAFESEIIAEQLTIIEKDALDEVDWKDLISLNWHQSPPQLRNWVEYLKKDNATGVDIVVARFNLVVKWVVSECILTEAPGERAKCITKFIHVATHCHRFRNYASTYQITLALLSADLARLQRTWSLVAPIEKQKLDRLEKLCQPQRNFQSLRAEMETAAEESGCIPFIGLYTHDLMFNAQKPSKIDPPAPAKEQLVNFERYQTAATIVKGLLRLIEASSRYVFHPHPEVLSRCLWLAALDDAEISSMSKVLE